MINLHESMGPDRDRTRDPWIYLSANNKWTKHIDSIIVSASKQVSYLRKLKYEWSKKTLNKLYYTYTYIYMRPLLEYGSEVWDGCSINDANRLEQIQLNSARIVTGLQILASLRSLYYETGWGKSGGQNANK